MKKMEHKKYVVMGVLFVLLGTSLILSGCTSNSPIGNPIASDRDKMIGSWRNEKGGYFTFLSDGTAYMGAPQGITTRWHLVDNVIVFTYTGKDGWGRHWEEVIQYRFSFSMLGDSLTLSDLYSNDSFTLRK